MSKNTDKTREKALRILAIALEKKGENPLVLAMTEVCNFCDYFILCTGASDRQVKAIYEHTLRSSKKNKIKIHHAENDPLSRWMIIDYFDVILHIFDPEARKFYALERVWRDAKAIRIPGEILSAEAAASSRE